MDAAGWVKSQSNRENLDRFIPNRAAIDWDYAHYMVTDGRKVNGKGKENHAGDLISPISEAYQKRLAEAFNMNRTRIFCYKNKPPTPIHPIPQDLFSKPIKPCRHIPQSRDHKLYAPNILDDFSLNLLDWGSNNVLAIALGSTVYLWDAATGSTSELVTFDDEDGPVASICWAPDGHRIAIGLNCSLVQLWDSTTNTQDNNIETWSPTTCRFAGLEQSHSHIRRNGW